DATPPLRDLTRAGFDHFAIGPEAPSGDRARLHRTGRKFARAHQLGGGDGRASGAGRVCQYPQGVLRAGVDLYELRADTSMKRQRSIFAWRSTAALHAKTMVFDRPSVWIGSFNLDPRSVLHFAPSWRDSFGTRAANSSTAAVNAASRSAVGSTAVLRH